MSEQSILHMPLDVLVNILKLLKASDLRNLMLSCKTMRDIIVNEGTLWKLISRKSLILMNDKNELSSFSWYNRCRISNNWCKGIFRNKIIVQHNTNYMPWLQFCDSDRLYLSVGSQIRCYAIDKKGMSHAKILWSQEVPIIKRRDVRTNDISRFVVKDNVIVCGNRDGCAAAFRLDCDSIRPQLLFFIRDCHQNGKVEVSAVEKVDNTIITVSNNSPDIYFWHWNSDQNDLPTKSYVMNNQVFCKQDIHLSNEVGCRCVSVNKEKDKLAIGLNGNSKPLLLDVNTCNFMIWSTLSRNVKEVVRDIQWHNENCIAYITHSGKLQIIDTRTTDVVYETIDPFHASLYCLKTDSNHAMLVGSSEYSRCVLFDTRSTKHIQIYFTQKKSSPIYSLDFDSTKLIAAADRGVASLNFNVNVSKIKIRDYSHTFEYIT
ncbi:unnamed protein product [Euphydryas editha]|uniref:F-box domain-containing protein n=1 Tax=Euphydryas editha TaxID=104508 RepID=A0AAU9U712_EUPED|nr:unnamed protein product [Euphydryas editha]